MFHSCSLKLLGGSNIILTTVPERVAKCILRIVNGDKHCLLSLCLMHSPIFGQEVILVP